jgi:phospholipid/cholesterol/gamma-HCH transport system substrate-binding protein
MKQAIQRHLRDFIGIVALVGIAIAVAVVILGHQRFNLPSWVPVLGKSFYTMKAEFETAQAVTPGQGQTVDIAGVPVGQITDVQLVNGRAVVTMQLQPKYGRLVHSDATMLLRPKTGLKDMIVELDPGSPSTPNLHSGGEIPIQNTQPDVNLDEVLSSLDGDSRTYLQLLLNGAGTGLNGQSSALSSTLRRFDPTARDLRLITEQLATRHRSLARVVHNFQALSTALAGKDQQLSQLVGASNVVFQSFANQDANLRHTVALLPGALGETQIGLGKAARLASALGPSLQALRPGARALGPSLAQTRPFLSTSTPIITNQLRPFTRAALPTVVQLRPAARNLAAATPDLTTTFKVANYLLNELAYNPNTSTDQGYLFWLSWANHDGASVFASQDANGPIRRGLIVFSCSALGTLQAISQVSPALATLTALTNAPRQSAVCPTASGPGNKPTQGG